MCIQAKKAQTKRLMMRNTNAKIKWENEFRPIKTSTLIVLCKKKDIVKRNEKASKELEGNDKKGNINRIEARAL